MLLDHKTRLMNILLEIHYSRMKIFQSIVYHLLGQDINRFLIRSSEQIQN